MSTVYSAAISAGISDTILPVAVTVTTEVVSQVTLGEKQQELLQASVLVVQMVEHYNAVAAEVTAISQAVSQAQSQALL